MNIHEAIMARTHEKPYITRRDWGYITVNPVAVSIKILPTNSPDGCVVESVSAEGPRSGWQPTAGDLAAEDWETVEYPRRDRRLLGSEEKADGDDQRRPPANGQKQS